MDAALGDPVAREQVSVLLGLLVMVIIVVGMMISLYFKIEHRVNEDRKELEGRVKALEERGP